MEIIISDRHEIFRLYRSICSDCKHLDQVYFTCVAFPEGIPDGMLSGEPGLGCDFFGVHH